jgi:hypothetical protein
MTRYVKTVDILNADTIESINEPVTVTATTTGGLTVTVPAASIVGDIVILNADGTALTGTLVEGDNLFSPADAAAQLTAI